MSQNYKENNKLSEDAKLLDFYLSQYNACINSKHNLERRRKNILYELNTPFDGTNFSRATSDRKENVNGAALSLRLDEINERIQASIKDAEKLLNDIMDVIESLEANTLERNIIEERYIDNCTWSQIEKMENISRSTAFYNWRTGLNHLLRNKRVQMIVKNFSDTKEI